MIGERGDKIAVRRTSEETVKSAEDAPEIVNYEIVHNFWGVFLSLVAHLKGKRYEDRGC